MTKTNTKKTASADMTAYEAAYKYLSSRMRTVQEVRTYLAGKEFSESEIKETIDELIEGRYLDDYQYALSFFEYNREKRRGTLRAMKALAEKGIDAETARNARDDSLYSEGVDEFSDALEIAKREIELKRPARLTDEEDLDDEDAYVPDEKTIASVARKLESRGFSRDIIYRVMGELREY